MKKITLEEHKEELLKAGIKDIIVIDYISKTKKATYKCLQHQEEFTCLPRYVLKGQRCSKCHEDKNHSIKKQRTKEQFIEDLKDKNPEKTLIGPFIDMQHKVKLQCKKGHIYEQLPTSTLRGCDCPYCTHHLFLEGESVYYTEPWMIKYFQNPEDAKKYYSGSNDIYEFICPDCGYKKRMKISILKHKGFHCDECDISGLSYPNKFLRFFIKQLEKFFKIDTKNYEKFFRINNHTRRYDGVLEYNKKRFFFEFDGIQHKKGWGGKKESLIKIQQSDLDKTKYVMEQGDILIRIPCDTSSKEEIKQNLLKSDLVKYFDLSNIDWDYIDEMSQQNIIKLVCNEYAHNHKLTRRDLSDMFYLSEGTISRYIEIGAKLGWCEQYYQGNRGKGRKHIYLYDYSFNFLGEFVSCAKVANFISKKDKREKVSDEGIRHKIDKLPDKIRQIKYIYFSHQLTDDEIKSFKFFLGNNDLLK